METDRLPVDAVAAAVFGGLLGALFAVFEGPNLSTMAAVGVGSVLFGTLGTVRWIHRLGDKRDIS